MNAELAVGLIERDRTRCAKRSIYWYRVSSRTPKPVEALVTLWRHSAICATPSIPNCSGLCRRFFMAIRFGPQFASDRRPVNMARFMLLVGPIAL